MKKKNLKSLKLNKTSISILKKEIYGGAHNTKLKSDPMGCDSDPIHCTHTCA